MQVLAVPAAVQAAVAGAQAAVPARRVPREPPGPVFQPQGAAGDRAAAGLGCRGAGVGGQPARAQHTPRLHQVSTRTGHLTPHHCHCLHSHSSSSFLFPDPEAHLGPAPAGADTQPLGGPRSLDTADTRCVVRVNSHSALVLLSTVQTRQRQPRGVGDPHHQRGHHPRAQPHPHHGVLPSRGWWCGQHRGGHGRWGGQGEGWSQYSPCCTVQI